MSDADDDVPLPFTRPWLSSKGLTEGNNSMPCDDDDKPLFPHDKPDAAPPASAVAMSPDAAPAVAMSAPKEATSPPTAPENQAKAVAAEENEMRITQKINGQWKTVKFNGKFLNVKLSAAEFLRIFAAWYPDGNMPLESQPEPEDMGDDGSTFYLADVDTDVESWREIRALARQHRVGARRPSGEGLISFKSFTDQT